MDRLMPQCLHEEILLPARKKGQRVTLVGISMGGLGALMTALIHPQEVQEVLLLSPFVGDEALMTEIRSAGGIRHWQPGEIVPRNKNEAMKKLWAEMQKRWLPRGGPPMPIQMITGREDRLLASNRLFAESFLSQENFSEIEGGHEWRCWGQGMKLFLEK
jgi:enterochelin esterase-like enzyme